MSRIIGIDLGTTNSCVSIMENGDPVVIPNSEGSRTTPSIVGFGSDGERFVGQVAKRQAITNPRNTAYAVKRLIGRRYDDQEVRHAREICSFEIARAKNGDAWIRIGERDYAPAEISAIVLGTLRDVAEDFVGDAVMDAVITVPAYFNDGQRQATRDAGRIAGLNVLRIINEPTAASLAYGLGTGGASDTIAVYDLGGGTFDISILQLGDGLHEVLATNGDTYLGGEDFDNAIVNMLADEFQNANGMDPRSDPMALQRLREAAEKAKHELSVTNRTEIHLPFLMASDEGPLHLTREMTRVELENLVRPLIERTLAPCEAALSDARLGKSDITEVVLVGGMTRMPLVQAMVTEFFGREPNKSVNPDEVVAVGAAVQGGVLTGDIEEVVLLDVTPLSLGIETMGGVFTPLIERNTPIPCSASEIFTTTLDNQDMVSVHVLQGERHLARDNHTLARFELFNIPPARRGEPQIEVAFDIDVNGIVSVSAVNLNTGEEQVVRIVAAGGLDESQIQTMIEEAEAQRDADQLRVERVELANKVRTLLYTTEKSLREYATYLKRPEIEAIERVIEHARGIVEEPEYVEVEDIDATLRSLEESAQRIAEAMYAEMMYNEEG